MRKLRLICEGVGMKLFGKDCETGCDCKCSGVVRDVAVDGAAIGG